MHATPPGFSGKKMLGNGFSLWVRLISIVSTVFFGVNFDIFGVHLNVERLLYFLCPLAILLNLALNPVLVKGCIYMWAGFAAWLIVLFISLILSDTPVGHIPGFIIATVPFMYFLLFSTGGSGNEEIVKVGVEIALWSIILLGMVAITFSGHGWVQENLMEDHRLRLTMFEPNILGSTTGILVLLLLPYLRATPKYSVIMLGSLAMLLLSFSKGPYLAFILCTLVYYKIAGDFRSSNNSSRLIIIFFGVGVSLVLLFALSFNFESFEKFYSESLEREDAINNRMRVLEVAVERFLDNPLFGRGPLDLALSADYVVEMQGADTIRAAWIWQMGVSILHDSGIVGFFVYSVFILQMISSFFSIPRELLSKQGVSYFCAFIMVLACSQATTVHLNAMFGIVAGLLLSYVARVRWALTHEFSASTELRSIE
jgi:hypothetical protein